MRLIGVIIIIFTLLLVPSTLVSHENHWYDPDCCTKEDCEPIISHSWNKRVLTYSTDKYKNVIVDLDKMPKGGIRASKDDKMHACTLSAVDDMGNQGSIFFTRCLYFPGVS